MGTFLRLQPRVEPFNASIPADPQQIKLGNGASIYLIDAGTEEVMRIDFIFRAGMVREYLPLLATTTNMMLAEGTQNYNARDLSSVLDYYGIFMNLYAEKDLAGLTLYFLNKHAGKALELASEILFMPVFPENELELMMKKRLNWFRISRGKTQNLAMDNFFEAIFGNRHPYGRKVTEADFGRMNGELLKDFHSMHYSPEEMTVIVSGKITGKIPGMLEESFGRLGSGYIYREDTGNILSENSDRKIRIEKRGSVQSSFRIGCRTINKRHPDYTGLKFLNTLLGGYFGSRLMKNLREDKGYTYGVHSAVSSFDLSGFMVISTDVGRQNADKAVAEIFSELKRLQSEPAADVEMEVVRKYMMGEILRMFDGPFAIADSYRSVHEFGLNFDYYGRMADTIRSVTPDEIMSLANTYCRPEDMFEIKAG